MGKSSVHTHAQHALMEAIKQFFIRMHIPLSHIVYVGWTHLLTSRAQPQRFIKFTHQPIIMLPWREYSWTVQAFAYVITCPKREFLVWGDFRA